MKVLYNQGQYWLVSKKKKIGFLGGVWRKVYSWKRILNFVLDVQLARSTARFRIKAIRDVILPLM